MEFESSLLCSQKPYSGLYPDSAKSISHPPALLLEDSPAATT